MRHQADADRTAKAAATFQDRAARELETAPHVEAVGAALRDHDLRRASEELDRVWADSLELPKLKAQYTAAETQAISELAGRLERATTFTCTAYNELLAKESDVQVPRVLTEAKRRAPCTPIVRGQCNAEGARRAGP